MDPTTITSAILAICFLLIVAMYLLGYESGHAAANHRTSILASHDQRFSY